MTLNTIISKKPKDNHDAIWTKCGGCGEIFYNGELNRNIRICPKCNYYFPLEPMERMALLSDNGKFTIYNNKNLNLDFDKLIMTGEIRLSGHRLVTTAIDFESFKELENSASVISFMLSKIFEAISSAVNQELPFLLCVNGFAQISEQLASISAAISRLNKKKLLFISILAQSDKFCNFPGFAYLADIVIAESKITLDPQTNLKSGKNISYQETLGLFHSGLIDIIAPRRELRPALTNIIKFFSS